MVLSTRSIATVALGLAAASALAAPARADLVVLSSGRVISAASVVLSDETATIRLRGGGEVTCDRSLVVRVDPDETPWVDPAGSAAPDQAGEATARGVSPHDHQAGRGARRRRAPDPRGDLGGIGVPAAGAIAQGRARVDAGDA